MPDHEKSDLPSSPKFEIVWNAPEADESQLNSFAQRMNPYIAAGAVLGNAYAAVARRFFEWAEDFEDSRAERIANARKEALRHSK